MTRCKIYERLTKQILTSDEEKAMKIAEKLKDHIHKCPTCQNLFHKLVKELQGKVRNVEEMVADIESEIEIEKRATGWMQLPYGLPLFPMEPASRKTPRLRLRHLILTFASVGALLLIGMVSLLLPKLEPRNGGRMVKVEPRGVTIQNHDHMLRHGEPNLIFRGVAGVVEQVLPGFEKIALQHHPLGAQEVKEVSLTSRQVVSLRSEVDNYRLVLRLTQDYWVYIFQVDSMGNLFQLFPNAKFNDFNNPLQAGETYFIPSGNKWLYLDKNVGTETIYIVASRTERRYLETAFQEYQMASKGSVERQRALTALVQQLQAVAKAPTKELTGCVFKFRHE